ncbi:MULTISPECIES: DUF429 domain-containing protein [unclassified Sinorhizobium]|uniref:DUF429 domain-containing protein n=1 Tax=unclassified Sinorhizobium TaxID=2613772 RepID=UPI0035250EB9
MRAPDSPSLIAHCDWSIDRSKRWMSVARRANGRWQLASPELVGPADTLLMRLRDRAGHRDGGVLIGFDFPIGLPARYGRLTGMASFREMLGTLGAGDWSEWFSVADHPDRISLHRPFYPMRPGGTSRRYLFDALGLAEKELFRRCERATSERQAACMLFWTLGGNQVGKAAIAGWRDVIIPDLGEIGLWPFDGSLAELLRKYPVTVAETYPGDVYRRIGIPRMPGWSKRRQSDRKAVASHLIQWLQTHADFEVVELVAHIEDGFGTDKAGEDRFDATVGLLGMLEVVTGRRREGQPDGRDVQLWEGWILGQASDD